MREMKDSGIEWIGEIPADWTLQRGKTIFVQRLTKGNQSEILLAATQKYGMLPQSKIEGVVQVKEDADLQQFRTVHKKDFVISLRSFQGGFEYSQYEGVCSPAYQVFYNITPICHNYYRLLFKSDGFIQKMNSMTVGIREGKNIQYSDFANSLIPVPPIDQQHRIANYLDRKCSQIDAIIAQQQEVIEKLKAYKLSVITEVVTKGLNHNVPMKDSGVEWIGEVPEHWDFRRIKNCCLIVDCKNRTPDPDPDGEYIVVRTTCIRDGSFSYEGSYHTNAENFKEWTAKGQPQYGDIFFTREAPMGEACLVPDADNLCMGQRVMFFRPLDGSDPRYILYSIYGPLTREYIDSKNKGSTVGHLKLGQVASLPLFYCPPKEQSEIADYLDKRCGAIDKVVDKKTEIISKLTDYKKSLIYEVVTGKKEV